MRPFQFLFFFAPCIPGGHPRDSGRWGVAFLRLHCKLAFGVLALGLLAIVAGIVDLDGFAPWIFPALGGIGLDLWFLDRSRRAGIAP